MIRKLVRFDWAMKYILRDKANFDVLEGFLSALLMEDIKVLDILESESNRETERQKFNRVDLLVKDSRDRRIIIEIQSNTEVGYLQRLLYGTSKTIVENLEIAEEYQEILKVISISILYFNFGTGDDYVYHGTTEIKGIHTGEPLRIKKKVEEVLKGEIILKFVDQENVFPEYYIININKFNDKVKDARDEWIYMLKNMKVEDGFHSKNIDKAREKLDLLSMEEDQRKAYLKYMDDIRADKGAIAAAKEEGREEGRGEGRKDIARNLLDVLDTKTIAKKTGLTEEEVEKLKEIH